MLLPPPIARALATSPVLPLPYAVTDDIESKRRIGHKAILVLRAFDAGIGFGAMHSFECQMTPSSRRKTLQAGTELVREFIRAPVAVRQLFL